MSISLKTFVIFRNTLILSLFCIAITKYQRLGDLYKEVHLTHNSGSRRVHAAYWLPAEDFWLCHSVMEK